MAIDTLDGHDSQKQRGPAYYYCPSDEPLKYITIADVLNQAAERNPNMDAIQSQYEQKKVTLSELKDQAERLGAGFLKLGLKPGDRIGVLGVNTVHFCTTLFAAAKAGLIAVLLNPAYRSQELGIALKKVRAKAIVTDHKFKTQDYPAMLAELAPGMSSAPHGKSLSCPQLPDLSTVIVATEEKLNGCYRLSDVMHLTTDKTDLLATEKNVSPDDPIFIMFSSGSTGVPKAAVLSHFGMVNTTLNTSKGSSSDIQIKYQILMAPLFHVYAVSTGLLACLLFDYILVLPAPIFHLESTIKVLQTPRNDIMLNGTPTMFIDICDKLRALLPTSPELRKSCAGVTTVGTGGSSSSTDVIEAITEVFPNAHYLMGYGMTEASCGILISLKNEPMEIKYKNKLHTISNIEIKVVDTEGKIVPFGTPGEAWVRAPTLFLEYWEDEEKTRETRTKSGWLKTGDVAILSEDGYATIVGRSKDMINRGGEKIFPTEIEAFLIQHPEILQAQVYAVADKRLGEEVAVSIILEKSSTLTESSLKEYCKGKITHYKIPKYVRFVDEYPMTLSGKAKKFVLREMHEKELNQ